MTYRPQWADAPGGSSEVGSVCAASALGSYSIYLVHKPLAHVLQVALAPHGVTVGPLLAIVVVACAATGAALYLGVEAPFMRLRDRLVPFNFAPRGKGPELEAAAASGAPCET